MISNVITITFNVAADKAQGDTPFPERYGMLAYVTNLKMMASDDL